MGFVEETIYNQFLERVLEETKKMKIGDPLDRSTAHGPQKHRAHPNKLIEYCEIGVKEGARLLLGGSRCEGPGLYMQPTIFCDVEDDMYLAKEESFGPKWSCPSSTPGTWRASLPGRTTQSTVWRLACSRRTST